MRVVAFRRSFRAVPEGFCRRSLYPQPWRLHSSRDGTNLSSHKQGPQRYSSLWYLLRMADYRRMHRMISNLQPPS